MTISSGIQQGTSIEVLGFCNLNMLKFVKAEIPTNVWPAKIRILSTNSNGKAVGKLMYINIDGTNPDAVSSLLESNNELAMAEVDCEIDVIGLFSEAGELEITLPNTARLTKNHKLTVQE